MKKQRNGGKRITSNSKIEMNQEEKLSGICKNCESEVLMEDVEEEGGCPNCGSNEGFIVDSGTFE